MGAAANDTLAALRAGDLAGATRLDLCDADLAELPAEVFGLADTLEVLDISRTRIDRLPHDLSRLKRLRAVFASGAPFRRLPEALGDCPALSQVGFRGCGLVEVPAEALPPALRWLTLTDNRIALLPDALGERPDLRKLLLSGNRLAALPESLAQAGDLELLRIAANRFDAPPAWLAELPALAWLAWSGNPFDAQSPARAAPPAAWGQLTIGRPLGRGASGDVFEAAWSGRPAALKLFRGAMTSDGLPEREMAACMAAGEHPNLTGALGRIEDHPDGAEGLLMPLLPESWRVLAGPPSLESCSRDVYASDLALPPQVARRIARDVAAGAAHLHARGLQHGDLYAHNVLWDGTDGAAVLSDFGAAAFLPADAGQRWTPLDVRAFGLLLGELLDRIDGETPADLRALEADCVQPDGAARPSMAQALAALS
ncbi:leucine-rich repeat-containing protein kinase family protein [Caulobacter endophyticus]|uniref:leucine-rich repeat-containing protein kinase family protein n=1 Tax=Caulobacter endophyticus TaxID=2172652 RepID=UPI00240FF4CE|nr:leucine-rich repeat-containing protein kinase family protein [Caulobacter endophyticus]MDG2528285.1 leucine-rich repeat-containing protein kinase family protein [Caulobacter endophyticus]